MSRLDTNQPVTIQPSTDDDLYTFSNHWHSSFFGSFSPCHRAAFAWFCLPCYTAKIADRLDEHYLTCCINPCSVMALRTKVRAAFHIRGSLAEDCYTTMCCICPCAVTQMEKELDYQNIPRRITKKL